MRLFGALSFQKLTCIFFKGVILLYYLVFQHVDAMLIWPFITKDWYACICERRGKNANSFSMCLRLDDGATRSRGIHTVITAHARQQYFTKCQGCPYIIVEIIFSLAPQIDAWMFSINSPQAWVKNIDMSTFHHFFFFPQIEKLSMITGGIQSHQATLWSRSNYLNRALWAQNELHWQFALFSLSLSGRQNERCSF